MPLSAPSEPAEPAETTPSDMARILERQRETHRRLGPPSVGVRVDRLDRAIGLLVDYQREICEALAADFGHRSRHQSLLSDVFGAIEPLKHAKAHVGRWMKPERRAPQFPFGLLGAKAEIRYEPLGVVGAISPWNFPINLTFAPLAGILAAGNSVMIKPSEYTPATSALMARLFRQAFAETEIAVVQGGPAIGEAFSRLPFDHLIFTGATSVARHVMRAAAENLVPVTLELGGKSPVIIGRDAPMEAVAARVLFGKTLNAGQICLAPDYVLVPDARVDEFVQAADQSMRSMYPTLKDNPDYTSVINQRHFDRLKAALADAEAKGARLVELNPAREDFSQQPYHKLPPTLVVNPRDDMVVMQDEIFGPILPVKGYRAIEEAIDEVVKRPKPLGLYYFGPDRVEREKVLARTSSGGVTLDDVIMHVSQEDLPFGGVGPSGMGRYHGHDGFKTFSNAKAIYTQAKLDVGALFRPPYGAKQEKLLASRIKR